MFTNSKWSADRIFIILTYFLYVSVIAEGVTGCPPPNFKFSRPKSNSLTTEQPFVSFETTQMYLPQTFTTSDMELVEGKVGRVESSSLDEQVDRNIKKDTSKVKENPFWFEDIIKDAEQHYSQPEGFSSHQQHHHHRNQRAKRNHHKKTLSVIRFDDDDKISRIEEMEEKMLAKRSAEFSEEDYPQNEVFSASEVVGNIYNANDTLAAFAAKSGRILIDFPPSQF